jgi:hypothetical protein
MKIQHSVPAIYLPDSHPFTKLWRDHLLSLSRPDGPFDTVVDAFVAIALGNPHWMKSRTADDIESLRTEMRHLLAKTPPDIVLVVGFGDLKTYGLHFRESDLWPFVGISNEFIRLWMEAEEGSESSLGLTAVILTSLHHGMAHWIQTLVRIFHRNVNLTIPLFQFQKTGYSPSDMKSIHKFQNAPWFREKEAGNFLEIQTRGGIMEYASRTKRSELW